jgi:hypothetical protein
MVTDIFPSGLSSVFSSATALLATTIANAIKMALLKFFI